MLRPQGLFVAGRELLILHDEQAIGLARLR